MISVLPVLISPKKMFYPLNKHFLKMQKYSRWVSARRAYDGLYTCRIQLGLENLDEKNTLLELRLKKKKDLLKR